MLLDPLFATLGGVGTALSLLGILALVGSPAISAVVCPLNKLARLRARGR